MKITDKNRWPLIITGSHVALVGLIIWTIVAVSDGHVVMDRIYMTNYQKADKDANLIIKDKILFDKKYSVRYVSKKLNPNHTIIVYKVTTRDGRPINNAQFRVIATRPTTDSDNVTLTKPNSKKNGIYTFVTKLDGKGRWNIMAKIRIRRYERFLNIKTDTRDNSYITRTF